MAANEQNTESTAGNTHSRWTLFLRPLSKLPFGHPAFRAAFLNFGFYAASQSLRFASNLILTRLLVPEVFGIMALVNIILQGLEMISDIGVGPSIIQNPRGEDRDFMRTAWTMQIIRGAVLWMLATAIAWPLAWFYEEPMLLYVLPVAALGILIDAFTSVQVGVLNRRLQFGRIIAIDLSCYALSVVVMVVGALFSKTVWPLVIGGGMGTLTSVALSHVVLGGPRMRFRLEREAVHKIFHFGKWLFVSSILGFLCGQFDRIFLGKFMEMGQLGVYSIAFMLSQVMVQIVYLLSRKVIFPLYARTAEESVERLRRQTLKVRSVLLAVTLPPMWVLVVIAPELIDFLYDDRYLAAGWMLQYLATGAIFATILGPVDSVLMASGDSYRHMLLQFFRTVLIVTALSIGGYFYGATGVIFGYVASHVLQYPFLAALVRRYKVWLPSLDFAAVAVSAGAIALGFLLKGLF